MIVSDPEMTPPKLFLSYSWSTPEHEQWVVDLASELSESGIEVVFDKWDLREGHDAFAFMEKMVTDPTITKVVMVCDRAYAEKADGRRGGVGTEAQIISREVYESTAQTKFVAVIAELDEGGAPYLPTYYRSRIYIDLSDSSRYAEGFEKLVRWAFDRPLYVRPQIGKPPAFLAETDSFSLGTASLAKRAMEGFKNEKAFARGAFEEYLTTFAQNLQRLRIEDDVGEVDELVVGKIDASEPSRNEYVQVLTTAVQYGSPGSTHVAVHRFVESLLSLTERGEDQRPTRDAAFDHFKFIAHELFLYSLAIYLRAQDFESARALLESPYYVPSKSRGGNLPTASFVCFREFLWSLDNRNKRLKLGRLSLRADMLEKRSKSSGVPFQVLMQADFVCFMRAELDGPNEYGSWWPETLLYASRRYGAFEIFARATSRAHLNRVLPLLGVESIDPITSKLQEFAADRRSIPRWEFESFSPAVLMGIDGLGSRP